MCFATAAAVAGIAGAGTTAFGTIMGGQAAKSAADYRAEVARNNELIAKQNADYAIAAGQQKAATQSLKGAYTAGKIKTQQSGSGIDVNTGSNVNVAVSQREQEKLDTETVLHNAELQAYGYRTQATNFEAEAGLEEATGANAALGADIGAAGSLLSNASSVGLKWNSPVPTSAPGGNVAGGALAGTAGGYP